MSRRKSILAASLPLAALLGVAFLFDLLVAASTSRLFLAGVAVLGILVASLAAFWNRRPECLVPLLPFTALLTGLPLIDTSPLKPFARFYATIEPGMTEAEVLRVLDDQFPHAGRYPQPLVNRLVGPNHLGFILDPRDGRCDAEIVGLDFEAVRRGESGPWPMHLSAFPVNGTFASVSCGFDAGDAEMVRPLRCCAGIISIESKRRRGVPTWQQNCNRTLSPKLPCRRAGLSG